MTTLDPRPLSDEGAPATPLHPLLADRWSTRAFDASYDVTDEQLASLLEAARWAPSANNSQPWRFLVARRGTPEHAAVIETLAPGNRVWAPAASALVVVAALTERPDGTPIRWAAYDAGQAAAYLTVQAQHEGLAVHQMGGFDADRLAAAIDTRGLAIRPLTVLAVGRHNPLAELPDDVIAREAAPRQRHSLADLTLRLLP